MSQYPGGQQPPQQDPYYGGQPADPYGAPQAGQDPYYGGPPPADPYAPPPDPYYGGQPPAGGPPPGQQWYYGAPPGGPSAPKPERSRGGSGAAIFGIILVVIGVWVLFGDQLELDIDWSDVWPIAFVIIGALMVLTSLIPGRDERRG